MTMSEKWCILMTFNFKILTQMFCVLPKKYLSLILIGKPDIEVSLKVLEPTLLKFLKYQLEGRLPVYSLRRNDQDHVSIKTDLL